MDPVRGYVPVPVILVPVEKMYLWFQMENVYILVLVPEKIRNSRIFYIYT